jgi:cyclopropane-fatty-acyl-phospholipid synthase
MRESAIASPRTASRERLGQRLLRRLVFNRLRGLQQGRLVVHDAHGRHVFGTMPSDDPLQVTVRIHDANVYRRLALRGSIGVGEAYMVGEWSCDDLTRLMRLFVRNRAVLNGLEHGPVRLAMLLFRIGHVRRRNTRDNSRDNISAHYDLGNEFYRLFLDSTLMYSCAVFEHPDADLQQASTAKLERICRKLDLGPDDHVLEIGTGWGGFALHAARHHGCRVTTTTISREQYQLARERIAEAGLDDQVTVLLRDYRDLDGRYDKLVSIEMIEAVGHQYLDTYFRTCSQLLKDDGLMLLQAITIADQEYERARRAVDFIQQYIFPGGFLPSLSALCGSLGRATDLSVRHLEDIGPHYATTLHLWRERFRANLDRVRAQGFDEHFIRMWEYYFCYCEGGFAERALGTVQLLLAKPLDRRPPLLGALS